jgi:hypothetical protein
LQSAAFLGYIDTANIHKEKIIFFTKYITERKKEPKKLWVTPKNIAFIKAALYKAIHFLRESINLAIFH